MPHESTIYNPNGMSIGLALSVKVTVVAKPLYTCPLFAQRSEQIMCTNKIYLKVGGSCHRFRETAWCLTQIRSKNVNNKPKCNALLRAFRVLFYRESVPEDRRYMMENTFFEVLLVCGWNSRSVCFCFLSFVAWVCVCVLVGLSRVMSWFYLLFLAYGQLSVLSVQLSVNCYCLWLLIAGAK